MLSQKNLIWSLSGPTSYGVLQFEICMIHIDRGRKAPSGAFAKKFFPLPSVPICWPTSYCVHDSYVQILGRHLWFLPKKTVHKFFFSAACAYLGLLHIVCMIYKTNSGFAKRQFTSFFLCRLCLSSFTPIVCMIKTYIDFVKNLFTSFFSLPSVPMKAYRVWPAGRPKTN